MRLTRIRILGNEGTFDGARFNFPANHGLQKYLDKLADGATPGQHESLGECAARICRRAETDCVILEDAPSADTADILPECQS